jgi:hypothetical protein
MPRAAILDFSARRLAAHAAFPALVALVALVAIAAPGCSRKHKNDHPDRAAAQGAGGGGEADREAGVDTGHVGHTFVVTYDSGPVDRIRIVRDTAGRIVVEGASGFADGTKVTVTLLRPTTGGKREPASMTRAKVELGRFQTSPLIDESTLAPPPEGIVGLLVSVSFAPGEQSEAVMRASADGRRFRGHGMRELPGGFAVYEQHIEAPL